MNRETTAYSGRLPDSPRTPRRLVSKFLLSWPRIPHCRSHSGDSEGLSIRIDRRHPNCYKRRLPCRPSRNESFFEKVRRSEEHTSELQSLTNLVCRLLLEKKKKNKKKTH